MNSYDPRIKRLELPPEKDEAFVKENEYWQTYEVFHQKKRGEHHTHVGAVHAPNAGLALIFAKEQFGRRLKCVNLWVVRSADVYSFEAEDEDIFESAMSPEKKYRDASGFSVRERIKEFQAAKENAPAAEPAKG